MKPQQKSEDISDLIKQFKKVVIETVEESKRAGVQTHNAIKRILFSIIKQGENEREISEPPVLTNHYYTHYHPFIKFFQTEPNTTQKSKNIPTISQIMELGLNEFESWITFVILREIKRERERGKEKAEIIKTLISRIHRGKELEIFQPSNESNTRENHFSSRDIVDKPKKRDFEMKSLPKEMEQQQGDQNLMQHNQYKRQKIMRNQEPNQSFPHQPFPEIVDLSPQDPPFLSSMIPQIMIPSHSHPPLPLPLPLHPQPHPYTHHHSHPPPHSHSHPHSRPLPHPLPHSHTHPQSPPTPTSPLSHPSPPYPQLHIHPSIPPVSSENFPNYSTPFFPSNFSSNSYVGTHVPNFSPLNGRDIRPYHQNIPSPNPYLPPPYPYHLRAYHPLSQVPYQISNTSPNSFQYEPQNPSPSTLRKRPFDDLLVEDQSLACDQEETKRWFFEPRNEPENDTPLSQSQESTSTSKKK